MKELLRVAVDATPLLGPRTGVGAFTYELLRRLPANQVEPLAYATSWRGRARLAAEVPAEVRVSARPQAARPLRALWRNLDTPPIEWWTGTVELVHGTNFVVPPSRSAAALATVHDLTFLHHPELCTADTLQYPRLLQRALGRGAWVHTVSHFVAAEVVELLGAPPERVVAIGNGVSEPLVAEAAEGHRMAGGERYLLALGTVEPRKDLPLLVRAFDALAAADPELRLVLAGPDGWGAEALVDQIERSPHRRRIARLGWVGERDRSALLRGASALAYPSLYEGFGLPPLEAMSVGTPVVATTAGSLPEVLGDAALLVAPRDLDALTAALASVLEDGELRERLGAAGRERVGLYRWDRCAEEIASLYRRISG